MNKLFNVVKNGKVVLQNKTYDDCDHYVTFNANRDGCVIVEVEGE
jgi:hypothetical protein